jgi:hypothetical protein
MLELRLADLGFRRFGKIVVVTRWWNENGTFDGLRWQNSDKLYLLPKKPAAEQR